MEKSRWINTRHLLVSPGKNISKLFEKDHINFNFNSWKVIAYVKMFNNSRIHQYDNGDSLSNITQVPFKINTLHEHRWLGIFDNIRSNEWHKIRIYRIGIRKERGSMITIFPWIFIQTHDFHDGLIQRKSIQNTIESRGRKI